MGGFLLFAGNQVVSYGPWPAVGVLQRDAGRVEPVPSCYPTGALALRHHSCCCQRLSPTASTKPAGGGRFAGRKTGVPKANKQSWNNFTGSFLKPPFADWEIQWEHPFRAGAERNSLQNFTAQLLSSLKARLTSTLSSAYELPIKNIFNSAPVIHCR